MTFRQSAASRLAPHVLSAIDLARILSLPLDTYCKHVRQLERSAEYSACAHMIQKHSLTSLQETAPPASLPSCIGRLHPRGATVQVHFLHPEAIRLYRIDAPPRQTRTADITQARLIRNLHLINSRNELTHALIRVLLTHQSSYLTSLNPADLQPLGLQDIVEAMQHQSGYTPPDVSRISRLLRTLSVISATGQDIPLRALLMQQHVRHEAQLKALIAEERLLLLNGAIVTPWSDSKLSQHLKNRHGILLTRRSIGALRQRLGIPDYRHRCDSLDYLSASHTLGPLLPLTPANLAKLPEHPGVYEIWSAMTPGSNTSAQVNQNLTKYCNSMIYLGSSANIRARILSHTRGHSRNALLSALLLQGKAQIRFCVLDANWRHVERVLYQAYCSSFGMRPPCNRISP
ncbi:hypothetical protein FMZ60_11705 [Alcaligenaceae bacterium SJ-26]|nr:hypothetical protein FMZ60_11705 [Alcaligenaceae bacterium SJ-26]